MKLRTILLAALALCGCDKMANYEGQRMSDIIWKYQIEGHDYLAMSRGGLIHSYSCPCRTNHLPPTPPGWDRQPEKP